MGLNLGHPRRCGPLERLGCLAQLRRPAWQALWRLGQAWLLRLRGPGPPLWQEWPMGTGLGCPWRCGCLVWLGRLAWPRRLAWQGLRRLGSVRPSRLGGPWRMRKKLGDMQRCRLGRMGGLARRKHPEQLETTAQTRKLEQRMCVTQPVQLRRSNQLDCLRWKTRPLQAGRPKQLGLTVSMGQ